MLTSIQVELEETEVNSVEEVQETVEITVDSSAADLAERLRENESEVKLTAANGSAIGVESDAKLEFIREGKKSCMRFLDADVKRPLASVSGIKDAGDKVAFGQQESLSKGFDGPEEERVRGSVERSDWIEGEGDDVFQEVSVTSYVKELRERYHSGDAKTIDPHQITKISDLINSKNNKIRMKLQTLQILQIFYRVQWSVDRGAHIQAYTLKLSRYGRLPAVHVSKHSPSHHVETLSRSQSVVDCARVQAFTLKLSRSRSVVDCAHIQAFSFLLTKTLSRSRSVA